MLRHFVIFGVLKANFFYNLYNATPSPLLNVEFPVSRICLFLVQHWKRGRGLALNINRIWNKISDMLQLALDSVNCLNFFCRPLSEVYLCELWRFPLYIQALASLFSQKRLNAWFRLICYYRKSDKRFFFFYKNVDTKTNPD